MRRAFDAFYGLLMALAAAAMVAAFVATILGILDRQFSLGFRGLDAYAGYAIAAALFLAMPGTLQRGEHIRVTLILNRLPARMAALAEWWCLAAGGVLVAYLAWYAVRLVWVSHVTHDVSQASDATPLWIPQLAMALGCFGLFVAFCDAFLSRLAGRAFHHQSGSEAARSE